MTSIVAMPSPNGTNFERLYVLKGRGPRNPGMAFDAIRRDDEPDSLVGPGGNTQAICDWAAINLAPEELDELIDALAALKSQSQSMDEEGPPAFPGQPKSGGGMVSIAGDDRLTLRSYDDRSEAEG